MPLLRKVLLRLTVLALLLVALYCYQTSDGGRWVLFSPQTRNRSLANLTAASAATAYSINYLSSTASIKPRNQTNYYNIWCIFTKVASNSPMRRKFQIFTDSLLRFASVDIAFHVIIDDDSRDIAAIVIQNVMASTGKFMEVCSCMIFLIFNKLKQIGPYEYIALSLKYLYNFPRKKIGIIMWA
ncbi:uncharacterized protein LOC112464086 [Temnothorax curvispinosus]|uniref:Uncharacterized protein LOC112464086 n=1 Tax=Temnothorax curvispinosus TaxID=300111 RepID=A0A6J1R1E6_9HYME|nr:uncharacterized protein LOC112464086 [Temnothorax curvispinosus]XP_024886645.1 uncharacterized protein LOC112464086 [Temnothorax curvispinosus]XP_024886646.1 uncharacterized protein LOC112464086 [Temnothorax curvispinosus]